MGQDTTPLLFNPSAPPALQPPIYQAPPFQNPDLQDDPFANVPPELVEHFQNVCDELKRLGIKERHQAEVCLALDISRSMQNPNGFFRNTFLKKPGSINELLKKALAVTMAFDNDQKLEIFAFGSTASGKPFIATPHDYEQVILRDILENDPARTMQPDTNYAAVMRAVRQHYFKDSSEKNARTHAAIPVFMIMVTDGDHNREQMAAKAQFRASSFQPIFCKIIALKGKQPVDFSFLKEIDDAPNQDAPGNTPLSECNYIDNADFVELNDPSELTTDMLLKEYTQWVVRAREKTLITLDPHLDHKIVEQGKAQAGRIGEKRQSCCIII